MALAVVSSIEVAAIAKHYDATTKQLIESHPADWIALAGLPPGRSIKVVDADISSFSLAADKVVHVGGTSPYIAHFELQSGPDSHLDDRILVYNALLRWRHRLPVRTVVFLLSPKAQAPLNRGGVDEQGGGTVMNFRYRVIRVWQTPVQRLLQGGLGTLPLAPLADMAPGQLPAVLSRVIRRLGSESTPIEARELQAATYILMGVKYAAVLIRTLLKGVRHMKESTTYQEILSEGRQLGVAEGHQLGVAEGIELGVAKGRDAGRIDGARELLLRLGTKKFGPPSPQVIRRINAITPLSRLDRLATRLFKASNWSELLKR